MNEHTAENDAHRENLAQAWQEGFDACFDVSDDSVKQDVPNPYTCDADGFEDQPPCASCRTVGYCQGGGTRVIPPEATAWENQDWDRYEEAHQFDATHVIPPGKGDQ